MNTDNKICFYLNFSALKRELLYLPEILRAKRITQNPFKADCFLIWGLKPTLTSKITRFLAKILSKPIIYLEDGFVRSLGIGLSKEPTLSIIQDEISPYFDATKQTQLQKILDSDFKLTEAQKLHAQQCINKILKNQISKYNNGKNFDKQIGQNPKKILIIDQKYNDLSIEKGYANQQTFLNMLDGALSNPPDHDIIIKKHPDSIIAGKKGYFSEEILESYKHHKNLYFINENYNPISLIKKVDKVFVATSFFGFEALLAGKQVHCYGTPFYAGRGLTSDKQKAENRNKPRTLEEIFHATYIMQTKYHNPTTQKPCELDDLLAYITKARATRID